MWQGLRPHRQLLYQPVRSTGGGADCADKVLWIAVVAAIWLL